MKLTVSRPDYPQWQTVAGTAIEDSLDTCGDHGAGLCGAPASTVLVFVGAIPPPGLYLAPRCLSHAKEARSNINHDPDGQDYLEMPVPREGAPA